MLDLLTAGTLAYLPLTVQSALFTRILRAHVIDDDDVVTPSMTTIDLDTLIAEVVADRHRARSLLDAARAAADRAFTHATREGIHPIPWGASDYPCLLPRIVDPPPLLWSRGNASLLLLPTVAIVGSRGASPYGLEVAHRLAADLAAHGVIVVSGLARGVDSASHRGALTRGTTAAILGSGADVIYPAEHAALAAEIARRGVLLTEQPPGAPPRRHHFPRRNRLISGTSLAVVVVEASTRSGSLQTARLALEQGREVMAVPGTILSERNRGSHGLLRDGAKLVEEASDILDELRLPWTADPASSGAACRLPETLAAIPSGEVFDFQELISMTSLTAGELLRELLRGEVAGHIVRTTGSRFLRVGRPVVR